MNKIFTTAIALISIATSASAAGRSVDLQGVTFDVDTIAHYYIGPGVTHTQLRYTQQGSTRFFNTYVIDMDRTAKGAERVRPKVEVGKDATRLTERITDIAKRKSNENVQYIAAVNGDFFITQSFCKNHPLGDKILGYTNMPCAVDGMLTSPDIIDKASRNSSIAFGPDKVVGISIVEMYYRITNSVGTNIDATALNYPRASNEMVIYNKYFGESTQTDDTGYELVLELAQGETLMMNRVCNYVVKEAWRKGGNSKIPENGVVISYGPSYTHKRLSTITGLKAGDTLKLRMICKSKEWGSDDAQNKPDIMEICGGDVRVLKDNLNNEGNRYINARAGKYSRTLVGYSQDRNHVVYCCIDRKSSSDTSGVTYDESADVMRDLGCWDALDLDGGGSTCMWEANHGYLNYLRDGSERAVGNGLFVRMDAPKDNNVASICFHDWKKDIGLNEKYTPVFYGYNKYGRLIDLDVKGVRLSAPAALGSISDDGTTLTASGTGTYLLSATKGDMSANLVVNSGNISAVEDLTDDRKTCNNLIVTLEGNTVSIPFTAQVLTLIDAGGRVIRKVQNASSIDNLPSTGLYFITALVPSGLHTAKLLIH